MTAAETEIEMVRRHVRQGAKHVANQRALIAKLRTNNLPTETAEALLTNLEDTQHLHEAHLARLKDR